MIKSFLLTALIILSANLVWSQSAVIDSLENELSRLDGDTIKVNTLLELAKAYAMNSQFGEANNNAVTGLELSKTIEYSKGEMRSLMAISNILRLQGDYPRSLEYLEEALVISHGISDKHNEAVILNNLSLSFRRKGDLDKAIKYAKNSLKLYEDMDDKLGMGTPLQILGVIHESKGDYTKAISYFSRAKQVWEEVGNKSGVANILSSFGVLNFNLENYDKALSYHMQYLKIHQDLGNRHHLIDGYLEIGGVYSAMNKLDSALIYYEKTLQLQNELDITYATGYVFYDMGVIYHKKGNLNKAILSFNKALTHNEKVEDYEETVKVLNGLASTYFDDQNYGEAIEYAKKGLALAIENDQQKIIQDSYNTLAKSYAALGRYKEAFLNQEKQMAFKDSIFNSENAAQIAEMNSKFEVEKKEQQISNLQKETELAELRKNILIGSIIVIIIVAFLLYNQQRIRSKKNRLLLEKEKELDRMKSQFFANISHEFRTPLTLLIGPIEEIKQSVKDSKTRLYLDMMRKNAGKLLNQVNQLLDLSKLDAGQLNLKISRFDIVSFVRGTVMSFESLADSREINLSFSSKEESLFIFADKDCIEKIVVNLVSNALKFTKVLDSVSVAIRHQNDMVEIVVSDTGQGFDPSVRKHIFERYYHTESDIQASTGIGLALVKELVEKHKGTIEVSGGKGQGSTFSIELPIGSEDMQTTPALEESEYIENEVSHIETELQKEVEKNTNENILIIEDNEDVRLFIKEVLKTNYKIIEAENGEVGLLLAEEHLPDLIITDIMMPKMNGYEVTQQLKQSEKTSHIPIIMLTAKADQESKIKGLETEADDYITKPFDGSELITRISNLINIRKKLREQFGKMITLKPKEVAITSVDARFLEKVMISIEDNMDNETLSVESLGQMVGMSRSQIHRKLQALTGQPPNRFIRNMRLSRAMELLKNNAGSVAEIGYMTGFSSPNYFSKCFHDQFGYAPGEVKKQA